MTTTTKNTIKREDRGANLTSTYKTWLAKLDALLAEAGAILVPREISDTRHVYGLKDINTDTTMGTTITMQDYAIKTLEANLLHAALADVMATHAAHDRKDAADRRFTRRMRRNLSRLEPTLAYLNGRLHDTLKDSTKQVSAAYGIMKGETEPSAFLVVTEPCRTPSGETLGERHLLETHTPNDVLAYFGIEADK